MTVKKKRGIYVLDDDKPFKLSRSKIDLFVNCPRCFYLDRKLGIKRPSSPPYTLNSAVDNLLKNEFDWYRKKWKQHPLLEQFWIDAIPVIHAQLDDWRNNFRWIQFHHEPTNFLLFWAIDDLWLNPKWEYVIVDYKATAINDEIKELNKPHHESYKRQMEIYQWLLRHNWYKVSDTWYILYCNGRKNKKAFKWKLEFDMTIIPYKGKDKWVEKAVMDIYDCLNADVVPDACEECEFCKYREKADLVI